MKGKKKEKTAAPTQKITSKGMREWVKGKDGGRKGALSVIAGKRAKMSPELSRKKKRSGGGRWKDSIPGNPGRQQGGEQNKGQ